MKFIRKALWPTAIVAAFLMLFGALGSAINADTVTKKGTVQTADGGSVVYVEVDVDNLLADTLAAQAKAVAAEATAEAAHDTAQASSTTTHRTAALTRSCCGRSEAAAAAVIGRG